MSMSGATKGFFGLTTIVLICLNAEVRPQTSASLDRPLLNSERILQRFGSYNIEILEASGSRRISNLFSEEQGRAITRSFAIVEFEDAAERVLSSEHEAILAGESIGETLVSRGWSVEKSNRYFGILPSTPRLNALMGLDSDAVLGVHVYWLYATRSDEKHLYATVAEVHHPDYLRLDDLIEIYGVAETPKDIEDVLAQVWQKMN